MHVGERWLLFRRYVLELVEEFLCCNISFTVSVKDCEGLKQVEIRTTRQVHPCSFQSSRDSDHVHELINEEGYVRLLNQGLSWNRMLHILLPRIRPIP